MIKKKKIQLIITSVAILLPIVIGLILWKDLPVQIPTHWGMNGEVDGYSSKGVVVFGLPLILLAIQWLCVLGSTKLDPKGKDINGKMMSLVLWLIPIISIVMSSITYMVAMGKKIRMPLVMIILMGIMFILVGNYLPKCKQSYTMGIKLPWTLKSEENWKRTHRLAGVLWVIGGIIILATAFFESFIIFASLTAVMVIVPTVYSYLYYRKEKKSE